MMHGKKAKSSERRKDRDIVGWMQYMGRISSTLQLDECLWICPYRPKILLLFFGPMQRPITFPFPLYQPPVKIDISLSPCARLASCFTFLISMRVSTAPLSSVIIMFFSPHMILSLSLFLPRSPLSLIFSIFNIQPTFTCSYDTLEDQCLLLEARRGGQRFRDVRMKKQGGKWRWRKWKREKGLCVVVFLVLSYRTIRAEKLPAKFPNEKKSRTTSQLFFFTPNFSLTLLKNLKFAASLLLKE